MNKYERHLQKNVSSFRYPAVYTGKDMQAVVAWLISQGCNWRSGKGPSCLDEAVRVDEACRITHADLYFYKRAFPELEIITL